MKKLFILLAALVMMMEFAATASAATITITNGEIGATYTAYKLMSVTHDGGDSYAYTVNSKYSALLNVVAGKTTDEEIIAYLKGLTAAQIRTFADDLYMAIDNARLSGEYTTNRAQFRNVESGYYLIAETAAGPTSDSQSMVLLDTLGEEDIEIETKESVPVVTKKVQEKNDSDSEAESNDEWRDSADYDIGDEVPFALNASLPDNYESYESYELIFHDTMQKGLLFTPDSVQVKINGTEIDDAYYTVSYNKDGSSLSDGCTFEITFDDLREVTDELEIKDTAGNYMVDAYYTAKLNSKANIGQTGNQNKVKLEYSNNPYSIQDGTTGETPEDRVLVFTYELQVNKKDDSQKALKGAGFTLYKKIASENDEYIKQGNAAVSEDGTVFTFSGLDAGDYKLSETMVPDGYNKADDIEFRISASSTALENDGEIKLESLKITNFNDDEISGFATSLSSGLVSTDIINEPGVKLPSTGGVGTQLFYIVGGILVGAALLLLIVKRRMENYQE